MEAKNYFLREYAKAEKAYLESDFAQAAKIIDHLAEKFPNDPNVLLLRGHIYCYGFQNYNLAIQQYLSVLKLTSEKDLLDFAQSAIRETKQLQGTLENSELSSKNYTQESFKQSKMTNNSQVDENKKIVVTQAFIDKLIDKIGNILKEQHALKETDEEQAEAIESLLEKLSSIENNFDELTKSLAKGSFPLKLARSIKVAESTITPKIVPIAINKSQLITTYNEIAALLSSYVIPVTLTPDSYRNSSADGIVLETTIKGNYWAITTEENKQYQYWLVPNSNINFNIHKLKTIESLFQLEGNYNSSTSEFILQEPAVLSLLPDNKHWKLLQPGILFFGNNLQSRSPQSKQPENITDDKQILSSLKTFETTIAQLTNKITQLEIQSELSQKTYQRDKQEWLSEKKILNEQIKKTDVLQSQLNNFINQSDRPLDMLRDRTTNDSNNNLQQNLSESDLAIIKSLKLYFEKMPDFVRRYHSDHHAPKEEADIIANYLLKASTIIDNTKTNNDLIKLFEYLVTLKGKVSQYNHNEYKYRWSVILENEILTKLQKISILQSYQSDKFDQLIIQQTLNKQVQINTVIVSEKNQNEENDLKNIISQFRQAYTKEQKLILDKIVAKVAISVDTLEQITFHKPDIIILENTPHGKYWIIDYLGAYFLIPSDIQQITKAIETSSTVAKILFHLAGYYPQYSSYHLIRPAIVTKFSANQWKLQEKGKFNFS